MGRLGGVLGTVLLALVMASGGREPIHAAGGPTSCAGCASRWSAFFAGQGDAYQGKRLYVHDRLSGRTALVGRADPFVRPVWSPNQRALLYVRVRQAAAFPGARWSLLRYDRVTGRSSVLAAANAMTLSPLGWAQGTVLYAVGRETATSVYRIVAGRSIYLAFLFTQALTGPSLSPGGKYIAYVTPTDCTWCTISIFDMQSLASWFGPVGVPSKDTAAWTRDGGTLVTIVRARVVAIDARTHTLRRYRRPGGLPAVWIHPMRAVAGRGSVRLVDTVTGRVWVCRG